jgi:hypothetical protein
MKTEALKEDLVQWDFIYTKFYMDDLALYPDLYFKILALL